MLSNIVAPGQIVELQSVAEETEENAEQIKKVYRTSVFDILTEDRLEVVMPMEKTKMLLLPINGEFNLCFMTDNGIFQCFARVIDRYKSNNVFLVAMELTSNLRKYQRREYYRFSCALEMNSRMLEREEIKAVERNQLYLEPGLPLERSVVVDISGGGLRFLADYAYEPGSLISCNYTLLIRKEAKEYHLIGKVLSVQELDNRPGVYEHRVQYVNMDVDDREEIIQYIFEEERKSRHKESKK